MNITYRYRVRDKHAAKLTAMARATNFVWNYCNGAQLHAVKWNGKWPTAFDLHKMTAGSSKELGLHSTVINAICTQYARSRSINRKRKLRFRGKKSLGWVPLRAADVRPTGDGFRVMGARYRVWMSRQIPAGASICDGSSLAQDARGRWFINVAVRIEAGQPRERERSVGTVTLAAYLSPVPLQPRKHSEPNMQNWTLRDLVFAYATLRGISNPTDREKEMIAGLEPHLYTITTTIVEAPSPTMKKFGEILAALKAGDTDGCARLMDELAKLQEPEQE